MDEENQGFSIPANRPMFDEGDVSIEARPLPQSDFFMTFANEAGDKAVILTPIEAVGDEILERHGRTELESYAQTLMDTGDDPMELQIGKTYEGENALADADAEAFRLDEEFNPGEAASDEDIVSAVDAARADAGAGAPISEEAPETEEPEEDIPFPLNGPLGVDETGNEPAEDAGEEDETEELPDVEEEPMLDQLRKKKPE